MKKPKVLLFKAPKEEGEDPYERELSKEGFVPFSVPVLEFQFVNVDILMKCLQQYQDFSAIVFTSQQSVRATYEAARSLEEEGKKEEGNSRHRCFDMPCCVVGPGTQKSAEAAGFHPDQSETGNADKLADYIIKNKTCWKNKDILYPCGNLRKDTLPLKMKDAGFTLKEIKVYQTIRSGRIEEKLQEMINSKGLPDAVVYFSPSGVQFTSDLIASGRLPIDKLKVIAIGPSTAKELRDRGFPVHCTAETPDAPGVLQAVKELQYRPPYALLKKRLHHHIAFLSAAHQNHLNLYIHGLFFSGEIFRFVLSY